MEHINKPFWDQLKDERIFVAFDNNKIPYAVDGSAGVSKDSALIGRGTYEQVVKLNKGYAGIGLTVPVPVGDKFLVCLDFDWKRSKDLKPHPLQQELISQLINEGHSYEKSHSNNGCHFWVLMDKDKIPASTKLDEGREIEVFSGFQRSAKNVLITDRELSGGLKTLHNIRLPKAVIRETVESKEPLMVSASEVRKALSKFDPDMSEPEWRDIGCMIHHEFEGSEIGFEIFNEWSSKGTKYDAKAARAKWEYMGSYEGESLTIRTLFSKAKKEGYEASPEVEKTLKGANPWLSRISPISVKLSPPNWLVDGILSDKMTMIAGSPGVGKTSCLVPLSLVVAGFKEKSSDITCKYPRKVIYVTEDKWQIDTIIHGVLKHMTLDNGSKISYEQISESFIVVETMKCKVPELIKLVDVASDYITEIQTENGSVDLQPLIVFDTASSTFLMDDENNNSEASKFVSGIKENFVNKGYPVWVVSHIAKGLKRGAVEDLSVRGAGAFEGDANCVAYLIEEDNVPERFFVLGKHRYSAKFKEITISSTVHSEMVFDSYGEPETVFYRYSSLGSCSALERLIAKEEAKEDMVSASKRDKKKKILDKLAEIGECSVSKLSTECSGVEGKNRIIIEDLVTNGYMEKIPLKKGGFNVKLTGKHFE